MFPALACGQPVQYYVAAQATSGITWTYPAGGPAVTFDTTVGSAKTTFVADDFQTDNGWYGGGASDTATSGLWVRADPIGTSAQPEDDHSAFPGTRCWVTGNAPGNTVPSQEDVDGGYTRLLSPKFDLTGSSDPYVRYWMWYSNSRGNNPGQDVFEVEISSDNGNTFSPLDTVGPTGPETQGGWILKQFRVADFAALTPRVRFRFTASDYGGESLVEAAIDDFEIFDLDCTSPPQSYCTAKPNSQGCATAIGFSGSPSATSPAPFDLTAQPILNNKSGLLFYGFDANAAPFQGGTMCVKTPVKRTPLSNSGGNPPPEDCSGAFAYDFNARIQAGTDPNLVPGVTVFAQYWYRDLADPAGFGTGLTNALRFTIQP